MKIKEVVHTVYFPVLETVNLEMYGDVGETGGMLHPSVIEQIRMGKGDAPIFTRHADGKAFSACQILDVQSQT